MDRYLDFTLGDKFSALPDMIKDLHAHDQRYVVIVVPGASLSSLPGFLLPFDARFHPQDPGISSTQPEGSYWTYEDGVKRDVFIKDSDGDIIIGKVWPGLTAFPDFSNEETHEWWYDNLKRFHEKVPFDGLWIVSMGSGLDRKSGFCRMKEDKRR